MARNFYAQVLRDWDWEAVRADALRNVQEDMDGARVGYSFLGTVMGIMPSGKYYVPFACGNVDPCPACQGTGHTRKQYPCEYCGGGGSRTITEEMLHFPAVRMAGLGIGDQLPCGVCSGSGYVPHTCRRCGGCGSEEAYRDERYMEALGKAASRHGGWIENGEGDPCDLFFCAVPEEDAGAEAEAA